jgi:hypothetical protein
MARAPLIQPTDLRGASRLVTDGTTGLSDLVKATQERIASQPFGQPPARERQTCGVTGLLHRTIRSVARVAGGSVDALLGLLPDGPEAQNPPPRREALAVALNGTAPRDFRAGRADASLDHRPSQDCT